VEQFDVQSPELTVRETVVFSARLRLDPKIVQKDEDKLAFVDQILEEVELSDLAGSLVGTDEGGGLSFEQKKRLSIAVELAASPSILFLDEPTSGLDSRSALLVVRLLRRICDGGRTCVATVSFLRNQAVALIRKAFGHSKPPMICLDSSTVFGCVRNV
jgi:ABC-type multidrug transport system ATPase subunit